MQEKHEELNSCPLCSWPIEHGQVYTLCEPDGHLHQVLLTTTKERIRKLFA